MTHLHRVALALVTFSLSLLVIPASAGMGKYGFSGVGTQLVKTNTTATTRTIENVLIRYEATTTNTISVLRRYGSVDFLIESEAGTTVTNDVLTPTVNIRWRPNEVLVFRTSSETNTSLLLDFAED